MLKIERCQLEMRQWKNIIKRDSIRCIHSLSPLASEKENEHPSVKKFLSRRKGTKLSKTSIVAGPNKDHQSSRTSVIFCDRE